MIYDLSKQDILSSILREFKKHLNFLTVLFFAVFSYFWLYAIGLDQISLIPLFSLCGSGDGCGNTAGGGGAGGGGGGAGGGGGGGGGGNCGACGGGDCGGGSSTPFLCTWNGSKYVLENDILFGKPTSFFHSPEQGRLAYEGGHISGDLYRIRNSVELSNGKLNFQIKEIEPEESFFDHLSLVRVIHGKEAEVAVSSMYDQFLVFNTSDFQCKNGVINQTATIASVEDGHLSASQTAADLASWPASPKENTLDTGNSIKVTAQVEDKNSPLFLVLGARYHDWSAGLIPELESVNVSKNGILSPLKNLTSWSIKDVSKAGLLVLLLAAVWSVSGLLGRDGANGRLVAKGSSENDLSVIKAAFVPPKAFAEIPASCASCASCFSCGKGGGTGGRSLEVEYWDGEDYVPVDVIEPRYVQTDISVVSIPPRAIDPDGQVELRIRATKRHVVSTAFVTGLKNNESTEYSEQEFPVAKVTRVSDGTDYTERLKQKESGGYVKTIPGDVLDIEFDLSTADGVNEGREATYLIRSDGYYTAATPETYELAGNWVASLDDDSQQWLKEMYALKGHQSAL